MDIKSKNLLQGIESMAWDFWHILSIPLEMVKYYNEETICEASCFYQEYNKSLILKMINFAIADIVEAIICFLITGIPTWIYVIKANYLRTDFTYGKEFHKSEGLSVVIFSMIFVWLSQA